MPPIPRNVHSDDISEVIYSETTSTIPEKPIKKIVPYYGPKSTGETVNTLLLASIACFVLNYFQLFTSHYWLAVCVVTAVIDRSSYSIHVFLQYAYPLSLLAELVYNRCPTMSHVLAIIPTLVILIGIPMSVCLHRYFSHAAFETSRPMQFIIGIVACLAYQGGPLWWAAKHTRHHHFCDQPRDPHSALQTGFFYAMLGWTMNDDNHTNRDEEFNNPSHMLPEIKLLDKYYWVPVGLVLTYVEHLYGRDVAIFNCLFPMLLCRLITLHFNVDFHPATKKGDSRCKSVDLPSFMLATLVGEAAHDTHHKKPAMAKRSNGDLACKFQQYCTAYRSLPFILTSDTPAIRYRLSYSGLDESCGFGLELSLIMMESYLHRSRYLNFIRQMKVAVKEEILKCLFGSDSPVLICL
jgi:stearoyl-CoA desaturase (delta-9 desaturase)